MEPYQLAEIENNQSDEPNGHPGKHFKLFCSCPCMTPLISLLHPKLDSCHCDLIELYNLGTPFIILHNGFPFYF